VAIVESASLPEMGVTFGTLASLAQWKGRGGPALILLGDIYGEAAAVVLEAKPCRRAAG